MMLAWYMNVLLDVAMITVPVWASGRVETADLRLRLARDQVYKVRVTSEQTSALDVPNLKQETHQRLGFGYALTVLEVDAAGVMTAKWTFESVAFRQQGPFGVLEYDSTQSSAEIPPVALGYSALPGQSLTVKLRPDGRIAELNGTDAIVDAMMAKLRALPGGADKIAITQAMREQFSSFSIRQSLEFITGNLPGKPVDVGATWSRTGELSMGFRVKSDDTWTLTNVNGATTRIGQLSTLRTDASTPFPMGAMKGFCDLKGSQLGEWTTDVATGWVVQGSVRRELKGTLTLGEQQGKSINMSFQMQITVSRPDSVDATSAGAP